MQRSFALVLAAAVMLASFTVPVSVRAGKSEDMVKAADALDKAFIAALNGGDAAGVAAMYAADAVSFAPDAMQARGTAEIKAGFAAMLAAMPGMHLELTEIHNMPAGDVVIGWGLWKATVKSPDGEPMEMVGRYTDVKTMRDGKWVYIIDHASVPMAAQE